MIELEFDSFDDKKKLKNTIVMVWWRYLNYFVTQDVLSFFSIGQQHLTEYTFHYSLRTEPNRSRATKRSAAFSRQVIGCPWQCHPPHAGGLSPGISCWLDIGPMLASIGPISNQYYLPCGKWIQRSRTNHQLPARTCRLRGPFHPNTPIRDSCQPKNLH